MLVKYVDHPDKPGRLVHYSIIDLYWLFLNIQSHVLDISSPVVNKPVGRQVKVCTHLLDFE